MKIEKLHVIFKPRSQDAINAANERRRKREERKLYRMKCKHYLPENEQCCLKSGWQGDFHVTIGCDGNCRRMKNYDKKNE